MSSCLLHVLLRGDDLHASCSQVSGSQCVAVDRPATVRACAATPCAVAGQNLSLVYSPWTLCNSPCESSPGYSDRSAACVSAQGWLAAVDACPAYSGVCASKLRSSPLVRR